MLARCLDRAPAADDLSKVVSVWHDDMIRCGLTDEDRERVAVAIELAGGGTDRWPTPYLVKQLLPPKGERYQLDEPPLTSEERHQAFRNMRRILKEAGMDV